MANTVCPSCGEVLRPKGKPKTGQIISCSACESVLRVLSEKPFSVVEHKWNALEKDHRDQAHFAKNKYHKKSQKDLDSEDNEFEEEEQVFSPKKRSKKHTRPEKKRYAYHQFEFDDEDEIF